jgi:hypothetical protein
MEMHIYVYVSKIPHLADKISELKRPVHARLNFLLFLLAMILAGPVLADDQLPPPCLMQPADLAMSLPVSGFTWLPGQEFRGECHEISNNGWIRKVSGNVAMFLHADGPNGSGRYWNVTIGVGSNENSEPDRGVCLITSTVGWRTLQRYKGIALPWLDDLDGDGRAELIIWDSFGLREEPQSMAEFAIIGWVYRLVSNNLLAIDWKLSRSLARSIAVEYRSTSDIKDPSLVQRRRKAAEALERFADDRIVFARCR